MAERDGRARRLPRLLASLPVARGYARTLAATRAERDRYRAERDRLRRDLAAVRAERDRLADERDAARSALQRPSFVAWLAASRRRRDLVRRHGGNERVWELNPKTAGYAFACDAGVAHPRLLWRGATLAELDWDVLPERFVVKPDNGTATAGVFPLVREGPRLRSLFTDDGVLSAGELVELVDALLRAGTIRGDLLVEELIVGPEGSTALPHDWKCYCFAGRVELVLQKDPCATRSNDVARFRFYDRDWRDLGTVRYPALVDPSLPPPAHPEAVIDAAERVSAATASPFVRIDLYADADTVYFGELTPGPGGDQWYGAELDERLGAAWEDAEVRLRPDGPGPHRQRS